MSTYCLLVMAKLLLLKWEGTNRLELSDFLVMDNNIFVQNPKYPEYGRFIPHHVLSQPDFHFCLTCLLVKLHLWDLLWCEIHNKLHCKLHAAIRYGLLYATSPHQMSQTEFEHICIGRSTASYSVRYRHSPVSNFFRTDSMVSCPAPFLLSMSVCFLVSSFYWF